MEDTAAIGGAEINTLNLVHRCDPRRVELFVLVPRWGALAEALATSSAHVCDLRLPRFRSISFYWHGRKVLNPLAVVLDLLILALFVWRVRRMVRQFGIEILHTNGIFAHFAGGIASVLAGCRCVWHLQDIVEPQHRSRRWLLNACGGALADIIIAISPPVLEQLAGRASARAVLVPNGVDLSLFRMRSGDAKGALRAFAGGRLLVVLVARLTRWKGQHMLLEAARRIRAHRSDLAFALVGDAAVGEADYAVELQQFVRAHGLEDLVLFAGWRREMTAVYAQADMLVLPALEPEPFGLVVIEAMASGVPVVATNHGGPAHIIEQGVTGQLVPPGDAASLVQSIGALADSPELRLGMAERARAHVEQHFSIEAYMDQLFEIYEAVC